MYKKLACIDWFSVLYEWRKLFKIDVVPTNLTVSTIIATVLRLHMHTKSFWRNKKIKSVWMIIEQ